MPRPSLRALRRRHALDEYRLVRPLARRAGYDVVPANYYSPIPDVEALPPRIWSEPDAMPGVAWDLDAQLRHLESELEPAIGEFRPPADPPGTPEGYHYRNAFFNALDADVLYGMVRTLRPPRVLEVGSGYSTLVIEAAAERNRADGAPLRHQVFDPFPSPVLHRVRGALELEAIAAQEIPLERITELEPGEILFIDTTHTVKPAGDVVHLLLGALPALAPGVVVHIHDFFRPFEYPRVLLERYACFWQEHHLVQAMLAGGDRFEILCANHALARLRGERVRRLVPGLEPGMEPSSLWLRRRG